MNRAHQCSGSATGTLIVFEPCNMWPPEARSYLTERLIHTPSRVEAPQEVIPFHSHSCRFISLANPHIKLYLRRLSQFVLTKPHYISELVFQDIHRNAMVVKPYHMMWNEWGLEEVYEPLGAGHIQVCFSHWEAMSSSFHTSTFATFHTIWMGKKQVQDMKQITGWPKTPALQQRSPLAEGNGPFPWLRPTLQLCHPSDSNIVSR